MTGTAIAPPPLRVGLAAGTPPASAPVVRTLTPRQLQLVTVGLVVLTGLTAVVGLLALTGRHAATTVAERSAEPLMVDAQTIDTSLSDADSAIAGSFLVGQIEPADLRQRYDDDIARASAALSATSEQVGADPQVTAALRTISMSLPVYTGVVQTATFNQRLAYYPLAAAYTDEASSLMRMTILPAAQLVYATEHRHLADDQGSAGSLVLTVVTVGLLVVLLVALVLVQRRLSRQFRRTFNVPLVVATGLVALVGVWFVAAVAVQDTGVQQADARGSTLVSTFTQARILALQMRADDELTLLSRDAVSTYQADYTTAVAAVDHLLASARAGASPADRSRIVAAQQAVAGYRRAHARIRAADRSSNLIGAIDLASAPGSAGLPAASNALDGALATGITASQTAFTRDMGSAADALVPVMVLIVPVLVVAALLIVIGMRRRIDEYR